MVLVLLIAAPLVLPGRVLRFLIYAPYAMGVIIGLQPHARPELAEGVRAIARRWPEVKARAAGRPVHVLPDYASHVLLFELEGVVSRELPPHPACGEGRLCWETAGVRVIGGRMREPWPGDAFAIAFREPAQEPPPLPCPAERWHALAVVADCRNEGLP